MGIRRLSILIYVIASLCFSPTVCFSADWGQELFGIFLKFLQPDDAVFQLSSQPTDDGFIPWGYLECKNAKFQGMNIQDLRLDCFDAKVTPPEKWKNMHRPMIESMLACHAEGTVTEKDVNDYLRNRLFGKDKEWRDVSVRMRDGRIEATGRYIADMKLFRLKIRVDTSCKIVGRGHALWIDDMEIKINSRRIAKSLVRTAIDRLQPFVNMDKYNFPLALRKIEFSEGLCKVSTSILPKPVTNGLTWEFHKPSDGTEVKADGMRIPTNEEAKELLEEKRNNR